MENNLLSTAIICFISVEKRHSIWYSSGIEIQPACSVSQCAMQLESGVISVGSGTGTTINPSVECCVCGGRSVLGSDRCAVHLAPDRLRFKRSMYKFQNAQLQQAFDMMLRVDDATNLDGELALIRTCLSQVVSSCKESEGQLGPHTIAAITTLASEVTKVADTMARMEQRTRNQVSMETLLFFVQLIGEAVAKVAGPEMSETIVGAILELPLPQDDKALFRNAPPLARQPCQPSQAKPNQTEISSATRARIEQIRAESEALRKEIQKVDPSWSPDSELAPEEPEADE